MKQFAHANIVHPNYLTVGETHTLWLRKTTNFTVSLEITRTDEYMGGYYDGEDHDGSIQQKIDCGDLVEFMAAVIVQVKLADGTMHSLASDHICGNLYNEDEEHLFMNDGYFTDMLREACNRARVELNSWKLPTLRTQ